MSPRRELACAVRRALGVNSEPAGLPIAIRRIHSRSRATLLATVGSAIVASASGTTFAQSNVEGYVYGSAQPGSEVRIENKDTGVSRKATVPGGGTFRTPSVPPGTYSVTYTDGNGTSVTRDVLVSIGAGTSVDVAVDTVVVYGEKAPRIDLTTTEAVTALTTDQVENLPVARDIDRVALLAPGVVQGDEGFLSPSGKPLVSFGGASPGENTYFINGFNITDFRNFLGGATVPFEFYDQFELRTGGYSAEFGRALGGVVNAVTKRGTNQFEFGAAAYYQPNWATNDRPDATYEVDGVRQTRTYNSSDYTTDTALNLHASGPIIEDKLFFYALGVIRNARDDDAFGSTSYVKTKDDSPFFGGKLDWQIADDHSLEYTYLYDNTKTDVSGFGYDAGAIGELKSIGSRSEGGSSHILHYSGTLRENFTASALYGHSKRTQASANQDALTGAPCTFVNDARGGQINPLSCWDSSGVGQVAATDDERDAYRFDLTYILGRHAVKGGVDFENNTSGTLVQYEGGIGYRYSDTTPGSTINGGIVPTGVTQLARERFYNVSGDFEEKLSAVYIEDDWQITDRLLLGFGLRNETLKNYNKNGQEFLNFGTQLTPRLGFAFDLSGDRRTKLFGNAGRYTMPIATNTNIRFAGGEFFTEQFYALQGVKSDGTPTLGGKIGGLRTLSDGSVPVPAQSVDQNIDPMYQDEFILGIQSALTPTTTAGFKVTHRNLVRAVEDSSLVDDDGIFHYFLFNPGRDVTLQNPDGTLSHLSAAEIGYPEAKRKYWAAEMTFDQQIGTKVHLGGSYTWSHTYGNFEGVFQSDVQQDDAGITINFDTPGLALNTFGDLPNDRRHNLKLFGNYTPVPSLNVSLSAYAISGRPLNRRGNCPTDIDPDAYQQ